jgi:hypothetical protein
VPEFSADGEWIAFLDGDQLGVVAHRPLGAQPVSRFQWNPTAGLLAVITKDAVYMASGSGWGHMESSFAMRSRSYSARSDRNFFPRIRSEWPPIVREVRYFPGWSGCVGKIIATASQWEQILPLAWSEDMIVA